MQSGHLADVYTLRDIATAAGSTDDEALAVAGTGERLWAFDEAVRLGRLLVDRRCQLASTRSILFDAFERERGLRAGRLPAVVSGSLHLGFLGALLITLGLSPTAATSVGDEPAHVSGRLVFLATPGLGGGGGGGGLRQPAAPPKAETEGRALVASPLPPREPPKAVMALNAESPARTLPAERLPILIAPVIEASADHRMRSGLLEETSEESDARGSGRGGGVGLGTGAGLGAGSGAGVGPGTGGGLGGGPFRPGSGVTPPRLLREVKADYTEDARRRGLTGEVVLEIVVRRDGTVGDVALRQGLDAGLDERAIRAVRQWRFAPASRQDTPVDVIVEVGVEFRLR